MYKVEPAEEFSLIRGQSFLKRSSPLALVTLKSNGSSFSSNITIGIIEVT